MRVDSHHHLWHYDPVEYAWIAPEQHVLQRDFLPADLVPLLAARGFDAAIAVQARQTIEETRWLLEMAAREPAIKGVVGWLPLTDPDVDETLESFAAQPTLKGVRHIVQGEPDDRYLLRDDFNRGVARLRTHGLTYDILIYGRHLPHAATFVDRHPDQVFVLDHIAKPEIRAATFDREWERGLRELARRPHVACKLSGVVTEVRDPEWTPALIAPYLEIALDAFGPDRLLFGTDWPVCLLRCSHAMWVDSVTSFIASLSADEQRAIMGENAARAYRL
jgi:L-fucono-1,5-lactonase